MAADIDIFEFKNISPAVIFPRKYMKITITTDSGVVLGNFNLSELIRGCHKHHAVPVIGEEVWSTMDEAIRHGYVPKEEVPTKEWD